MDHIRTLYSLPLSSSQQEILERARFSTVGDVLGISLVELAKELRVSHNEALEIRKAVSRHSVTGESPSGSGTSPYSAERGDPSPSFPKNPDGETGLVRLQKELLRTPILTFCNDMDVVLGGGVQLGQTTEFCGWPGIGKTQLCKQLAIDVQIPSILGGAEGAAIYIDTEGSFMIERVVQMAEHFISHLSRMTESRSEEEIAAAKKLTLEGILSNIHYYRVIDYAEQVALIHVLPQILEKMKNVRLVIIDSIAFHFRHNFTDMALRTRLLLQMAQQLQSLAESHDASIVVTNQVTTKFSTSVGEHGEQSRSFLAPALGDTWSHAVTNRVLLFWQDGQRFAHLLKSPSLPTATAPFEVNEMGVRGIPKMKMRKRRREPPVQAPVPVPVEPAPAAPIDIVNVGEHELACLTGGPGGSDVHSELNPDMKRATISVPF